jgi:hypothetical protein
MDYDTIVAAVLETPRGRWFLREHDRRIRAAETRTLLAAIGRLEAALAPAISAREATDRQLEALAEMLHAARAGVAEVRHPLLEGGGAIPAGSDAFDYMTASAEAVAGDVADTAQTLQSTSLSLRSVENVAVESAALEREAAKLLTVAYRQEVLSRRVARAAGALSHMDQRLKGHLPKTKAREADAPRTLTPEHLKYFKPDEEIFARPTFAASSTPAPAASKEPPTLPPSRIVIVRRGSGEIPLLGEDTPAAGI